jgi:3-hydroxyisobutyrate dehydrogenase
MFTDKKIEPHTRLGFIGLGFLGSRIAQRLVDAGFPVVVYDVDSAKAQEFATRGVVIAPDPEKLAGNVDVVLSCLPNDTAVEDIYLGSQSILRNVNPGTRIIELSTISPETSRRLHHAAEQAHLSALDVAISGSTPAAEAGTLTLFGGGDRDDFEAAQPIFTAIGKQWFYMGPSGAGVAMKLVVNTLLGVGMQAVAEATALGLRLGLPRELLFDTLAKTAVVAPALTGKLATAKHEEYAPQFPVRLMHKDFELVLNAAEQSNLFMPATVAAALINREEAEGADEEDFSAVIRRMDHQPVG